MQTRKNTCVKHHSGIENSRASNDAMKENTRSGQRNYDHDFNIIALTYHSSTSVKDETPSPKEASRPIFPTEISWGIRSS